MARNVTPLVIQTENYSNACISKVITRLRQISIMLTCLHEINCTKSKTNYEFNKNTV